MIHLKKPKYSGDDIVDFHFYDFANCDRREIKEVITRELGWEVPHGKVSSWRFDCKLHNVINYCFKQKYGFSSDLGGYANMVRAGKMDRDQALKQEEDLGLMNDELMKIFRDDLKFSEKEIKKYVLGQK